MLQHVYAVAQLVKERKYLKGQICKLEQTLKDNNTCGCKLFTSLDDDSGIWIGYKDKDLIRLMARRALDEYQNGLQSIDNTLLEMNERLAPKI